MLKGIHLLLCIIRDQYWFSYNFTHMEDEEFYTYRRWGSHNIKPNMLLLITEDITRCQLMSHYMILHLIVSVLYKFKVK